MIHYMGRAAKKGIKYSKEKSKKKSKVGWGWSGMCATHNGERDISNAMTTTVSIDYVQNMFIFPVIIYAPKNKVSFINI